MSDQPSAADYKTLARRRIFFGHRSVGSNLMQGVIAMCAAHTGSALPIVETDRPDIVTGPAIFHAQIGVNGDPGGKTRAFADVLDAGFGMNGDIALHKYCYVDVMPESDVGRLFTNYRTSMEALRARYPRLVLAHVTIPLTTMETPLKAAVKKLLRRPAAYRDANTRRSGYNRMLLGAYGASGTVFDLARLQSTRLDGSRVSQQVGGETTYGLARELTVDGGHLNSVAQPIFAAAFLRFLAGLPSSS